MSEQSFPVRPLQMADVLIDMRIQVRDDGDNTDHIESLAEAYKAWKEEGGSCPIPPPVVYFDGKKHILSSGFSRFAGAKKAGLTELDCEVRPGKWADADLYGAEANLDQRALPLRPKAIKRAFVKQLHYKPGMLHSYYAKLFSVTPQTIGRWIKEVAPELVALKERLREDGTTVKVGGGGSKPKGDDKPAVPKKTDSTPVAEDADEPHVVVSPGTLPETETEPMRKAGEYPPDERFMPHAADAKAMAAAMLSAKRSLEAVRAELRKLFHDPKHVIASRLHYHSTFDGNLTAMIEDLRVNAPTHVCPDCAGTGEVDGQPCRTCDGYGLMSESQQSPLASKWKKTGEKYNSLAKEANLAETLG